MSAELNDVFYDHELPRLRVGAVLPPADVEYYKGLVAKAEIETTRANGEVAKAQADLAKAHKELMDLEAKRATQQNQQILALFDGVVTQLTEPGQLVKKAIRFALSCRIETSNKRAFIRHRVDPGGLRLFALHRSHLRLGLE